MFAFECSQCRKEKRRYRNKFEAEMNDAREEFVRLSRLLQEVCWYQFEVKARDWGDPWHPSDPKSHIELLGQRYNRRYHRGHRIEHATFPVWYDGPVRDAPPLPPELVLREVRQAFLYFKTCEREATAAEDWAPGGRLYQALVRTTAVGKSSDASVRSDGGGQLGH